MPASLKNTKALTQNGIISRDWLSDSARQSSESKSNILAQRHLSFLLARTSCSTLLRKPQSLDPSFECPCPDRGPFFLFLYYRSGDCSQLRRRSGDEEARRKNKSKECFEKRQKGSLASSPPHPPSSSASHSFPFRRFHGLWGDFADVRTEKEGGEDGGKGKARRRKTAPMSTFSNSQNRGAGHSVSIQALSYVVLFWPAISR